MSTESQDSEDSLKVTKQKPFNPEAPKDDDAKTPSQKTDEQNISALRSFAIVVFEYFFIFLVGFFIGSACTLVLAIYIVSITYKNYHKARPDDKPMDSEETMKIFFIFISLVGATSALYCLYIATRSTKKSKKHCEEAIET